MRAAWAYIEVILRCRDLLRHGISGHGQHAGRDALGRDGGADQPAIVDASKRTEHRCVVNRVYVCSGEDDDDDSGRVLSLCTCEGV